VIGLMALASIESLFAATILILMNIINLALMKTERLKKKEKLKISFFSILIIASTAGSLYSHYSPESLHLMNHTLFKTAYILGLLILVQGDFLRVLLPLHSLLEVGFFDRLNYFFTKIVLATIRSLYDFVEVGFFDQLNYTFSKIVVRTSELIRKIQTGNLNLNMSIVLIFFLLGLIFVFVFRK
jgi:hypothetical protein